MLIVRGAGGALEASSVTTTELGYVSGVTSAIQTQINGKQAADADLDDLADGELTLTKVQYFQLVDTSANICSAVPTAAANIALSNDEYDLYIATGTAIGQWRNSRTGSGPC